MGKLSSILTLDFHTTKTFFFILAFAEWKFSHHTVKIHLYNNPSFYPLRIKSKLSFTYLLIYLSICLLIDQFFYVLKLYLFLQFY